MVIHVITLFPSMFKGFIDNSIISRAIDKDAVDIRLVDLRSFGMGPHRIVDDTPFGGGGGMVMRVEPIHNALKSIKDSAGHVILTTPRGKIFKQDDAFRLSKEDTITIICGHYEGVDERVSELFVDEELSIGDYVLTGGEIPAMAIIDAVVRIIPGVLGKNTIITGDSHYTGLLEHPQYTRPREYMGKAVPSVLLSGNHKEIQRWRRMMSLKATMDRRPDMLEKTSLTEEDILILKEDG